MKQHEHMSGELVFATDWPRWDFDSLPQAHPRDPGLEGRQDILAEYARTLYKLD
tara:strand:+ start:481 stop:642 length:162 start_codon:yes stop_codon:yes gene_type:complete